MRCLDETCRLTAADLFFFLSKVTHMIPFDITKRFREVKKEKLFYKEDT